MTQPQRVAVLALVALGAVGALALRARRLSDAPPAGARAASAAAVLIELGSTSCKACKAMHEELAVLREECATAFAIEEIDVVRDEAAARHYAVEVIPTQVFLDAAGNEVDRHVGFLARGEIRERFARRGVVCP